MNEESKSCKEILSDLAQEINTVELIQISDDDWVFEFSDEFSIQVLWQENSGENAELGILSCLPYTQEVDEILYKTLLQCNILMPFNDGLVMGLDQNGLLLIQVNFCGGKNLKEIFFGFLKTAITWKERLAQIKSDGLNEEDLQHMLKV